VGRRVGPRIGMISPSSRPQSKTRMTSTDLTVISAQFDVLDATLRALMAELPGDARARLIASIQQDLSRSPQPLPEPVDAAAAAALSRLLGLPPASRGAASLVE
jgi:hypothetical protein